MKKIFIIAIMMSFTINEASAQFDIFKYGIRGGLNYAGTGKLSSISGKELEKAASKNVGFHIGLFWKFEMPLLYIMPEFTYTRLSSEYSISKTTGFDISMDKIDVPILIGYKPLPFASIFAGPSFQYIINNNTNLDNFSVKNLESSITTGINVGIGVNIYKFGATLRWESGLSQNNLDLINDKSNTDVLVIDTRPSQFIFSVMYSFN